MEEPLYFRKYWKFLFIEQAVGKEGQQILIRHAKRLVENDERNGEETVEIEQECSPGKGFRAHPIVFWHGIGAYDAYLLLKNFFVRFFNGSISPFLKREIASRHILHAYPPNPFTGDRAMQIHCRRDGGDHPKPFLVLRVGHLCIGFNGEGIHLNCTTIFNHAADTIYK